MRRIILLSLVAASMLTTSCSIGSKNTYKAVNERDVPQNYLKDFNNRRPNAQEKRWEKVDSLSYNVKFLDNGNNIRMQFKNTSVETYWIVPLEYTLTSISDYVEKKYSSYKMQEVAIAEIKNKKVYRVCIAKKNDIKVLEFDINGNFTAEVEETSEN